MRLAVGFSRLQPISLRTIRANVSVESRRDSATKPRVARHELPWESYWIDPFNPNGVAPLDHPCRNPVGVDYAGGGCPRVGAARQPLGFETESRWDSGAPTAKDGGNRLKPTAYHAAAPQRFKKLCLALLFLGLRGQLEAFPFRHVSPAVRKKWQERSGKVTLPDFFPWSTIVLLKLH